MKTTAREQNNLLRESGYQKTMSKFGRRNPSAWLESSKERNKLWKGRGVCGWAGSERETPSGRARQRPAAGDTLEIRACLFAVHLHPPTVARSLRLHSSDEAFLLRVSYLRQGNVSCSPLHVCVAKGGATGG